MKYGIGTQFIRAGRKAQHIETVTDYYVTRNLEGEIVKERYVSTHYLLGQPIIDTDVVAVTIARGLISVVSVTIARGLISEESNTA